MPADQNLLNLNISASHNIDIWAKLFNATPEKITEALEMWGLIKFQKMFDIPVLKFSTGMRRRLGLAIAHIIDSYCILLDEPSFGLDTMGIQLLTGNLEYFRRSGKIIILVNHIELPIEYDQMIDFGVS